MYYWVDYSSFDSSLNRAFCFPLSFFGVMIFMLMNWSPTLYLLTFFIPLLFSLSIVPDSVPGAIFIFVSPVSVWTMILHPSAARENVIGSSM